MGYHSLDQTTLCKTLFQQAGERHSLTDLEKSTLPYYTPLKEKAAYCGQSLGCEGDFQLCQQRAGSLTTTGK